jgi:hypothetical protein
LQISFSGYVNLQNYLQFLVGKYPFNSEFHHNLGHYQTQVLFDYDAAIKSYAECLKIEQQNVYYLTSKFTAERDKATSMLENNQIDEGWSYIEFLIAKREYYEKNYGFHSSFLEVRARYSDHRASIARIKVFEQDFENMPRAVLVGSETNKLCLLLMGEV